MKEKIQRDFIFKKEYILCLQKSGRIKFIQKRYDILNILKYLRNKSLRLSNKTH